MSGFCSIRRLLAASVVAACASGATLLLAQTTPPAAAPAAAPTPSIPAAPGVMPAAESSIAVIDGREINSRFFYDTLMRVDGIRIFEKIRDLALVQRECMTNGIAIEGTDFTKRFKDEFNKAFDSLGVQGAPGETFDDAKRLQIVNQVIQQRGINPTEFQFTLETRTDLRALAAGKVDVTEADVKEEYDATYGEKRHIRLFPGADDATMANKIRDAIEKQKKTPDEAATELKITAPWTGTVPANAKGSTDIVNVTFQVLKKVGNLSAATPMEAQNGQPPQKVLVFLEKIDPDTRTANPLNTKLHDEIKQRVFDVKQNQWMDRHLSMLRASAAIDIKDPVLKSQYMAIQEAIQRQAAAASQPAAGNSATITGAPAAAPAPATPGAATPPAPMPKMPSALPTPAPGR